MAAGGRGLRDSLLAARKPLFHHAPECCIGLVFFTQLRARH